MKNFIWISLLLFFASCAKENEEDINAQYNEQNTPIIVDTTDTSDSVIPTPDPKSFAQDVAPILNSRCVSCHNLTNANAGVNLSSYATVSQVVTPANSNGSLLYGVVSRTFGSPMPPSGSLSDQDIQNIKTWIDEGAINN